MYRLVLTLYLVLLNSACRSSGNEGALKHEFGVSSRLDPTQFETCVQAEDAPSLYVRDLATYIARANAGSFSGVMAIENFCFTVKRSKDREVNAAAHPPSRHITFTAETLRVAENDAAVAVILVHELAHVLMTHGSELAPHPKLRQDAKFASLRAEIDHKFAKSCASRYFSNLSHAIDALNNAQIKGREISEFSVLNADIFHSSMDNIMMKMSGPASEDSQKLALTPDYRQFCSYGYHVLAEIKGLVEKHQEIFAREGKEFQNWLKYAERLESSSHTPEEKAELKKILELEAYSDQVIGKGAFSHVNWREEEADEVGYELYLRAGFHDPTFGWNKIYGLKYQSPDTQSYENCMALIEQKTIPSRGAGIHPTLCHRYYNMHILERELHREDYAPLLKDATTAFVPEFSGRLGAVKALLKR